MGSKPQKSVTWNGVVYQSDAHAARALGISRQAMRKRRLAGKTCDDDMRPEFKGKPCVFDGEKYTTITAAAQANGVSVSTVSKHVTTDSEAQS